MNKKIFLILILFILASNMVFAEVLFDDYVFEGDTISVNEKSYIVRVNENKDSVIMEMESHFFFIDENSCEIVDDLEICFESTAYDTDELETKYLINITEPTPGLLISRAIEETIEYVGEETTVTTTFSNTGNADAEEIKYSAIFPDGVKISSIKGDCYIEGNDVFFEGEIRRHESQDCEYDLIITKELKLELRGTAEYKAGSSTKEVQSSQLIFDVENFVNEEIYFSDEEIIPGEETYVYFNFSNKRYDEKNEATIDLYLPPSVKVLSNTQGAAEKVEENHYRWSGDIKSYDDSLPKKTFKFKIRAEKSGQLEFKSESYYIDEDDFGFYSSNTEVLEVNQQPVSIMSSFDIEDEFNSGYDKVLNIWLQNTNEEVEVNSIFVNMHNELNNETRLIKYAKIEDDEPLLIHTRQIKMPNVTSKRKFYLYVNLSYRTQYGEFVERNYKKEVYVRPPPLVSISHSFTDGTIESGETTYFSVKIKNSGDHDVTGIRIWDDPAEDLKINGVYSRTMSLDEDEEIIAYRYEIKGPELSETKKYPITTTVNYEHLGKNYTYNKTSYLTIKRRELDISFSIDVGDEKAIGQRIPLHFTIENKEDEEPLKKIKVLRNQINLTDWVNPEDVYISNLEPNEEITLFGGYVRFKGNKSQKIPKFNITFSDTFGNKFSEETDVKIISDIEGTRFDGPSVAVWFEYPEKIHEQEETQFELYVQNNGNEYTDVKYDSEGYKGTIPLCTDCKRKVTITKNFPEGGKEELKAVITYEYLGDEFETGKSQTINVLEKAKKEPESILGKIEETITGELSEEAQKTNERIKLSRIISLVVLIIVVILIIFTFIIRKTKPSSIFIEEQR